MVKKDTKSVRLVASNKKVRHNYFVEDDFEAGIVLQGWEVKSIQAGRLSLDSAYVLICQGELLLVGAHISPLDTVVRYETLDPLRDRKLLMHRTEISRLIGKVEQKGFTLMPLSVYRSEGRLKVSLGLCRGKQQHDKREALKADEAKREAARYAKQL